MSGMLVLMALVAGRIFWINHKTLLPISSPDVDDGTISTQDVDVGTYPCMAVHGMDKTKTMTDAECLKDVPSSKYIAIFMQTMVGTPVAGRYIVGRGATLAKACPLPEPYSEREREGGDDHPPFGYTMIGKARMHNLRNAIEEVERNGVPGAIIELGVWRGGAMMFASALVLEMKANRDIYLLDAFDAIPGYGDAMSKFLSTKLEDVKDSFRYFNVDGPHVHFELGLFKDTLPAWKDRRDVPIAVLRIDGNFYDSYQDALYYLYDKVPVGGIVIFDDVMSHRAVMRAWLDFKKDQGVAEELVRIDNHSAWFRKVKHVSINWSHFRPPQDVNKA